MKLTRFAHILVIALALTSLVVTGCRKKPVGVTNIPGSKMGQPGEGEAGKLKEGEKLTAEPMGIPANPQDSHAGWAENAEVLKAHIVHFAFDSSVVRASEKANVSAVADYLKANPTAAVRVEGHCDERGTAEYNRSLGERRALAVREDLVSMGIAPSTVDTKSWGFEKPVDPGHDESAWKQNRRAEFIVLTPPAAAK